VTLYAELKKSDTRTARRELDLPDGSAPRKVSNVAPVEHRDLVYREFLGVLTLYPEHKEDLLRRGLDEAAIFRNGYKSVPQDPRARWKIARHLVQKGLALEGVPGFFRKNRQVRPLLGLLRAPRLPDPREKRKGSDPGAQGQAGRGEVRVVFQ